MGSDHGPQGTVLIGDVDRSRMARLASSFAARDVLPSVAFTTTQVFEFLATSAFDLVLVALGLGADDELIEQVVQQSNGPVIALDDHVRLSPAALRHGASLVVPGGGPADDICVAALQQLRKHPRRRPARLRRCGELVLDEHRRTAQWHGRDLPLTKLQHRLLVALLDADGAVLSRAELERRTYGTAVVDGSGRVVSQVRRIREKIERDPARPSFLITVRGEGFRLADGVQRDVVTP